MSGSDDELATAENRRRRAEQQWDFRLNSAGPAPPDADVTRLLHELQVHQIELEMQNEELQEQRTLLEQSVAKYIDLYDFAPVGYFTVAGDGRIREVNLAGATLLGQTRNELAGRRLAAFLSDATRPHFNRFLEMVLLHGDPLNCEVEVVDQNTITHSLFLDGIGVEATEGRLCRIAATDITARKQAEEALRTSHDELERRVAARTADLNRSRDELALANDSLVRAVQSRDAFLASMSHELRTPLSSILGLTEVLALGVYGPQSERAMRALASIEASGRHLLDLISDILDVEKIEAGKLELVPEGLSLDELATASIGMIEELAAARQQHIAYHIAPINLHVIADPQRLKQVLVNLLSNAVKFSPIGGHIGLDIVGDETAEQVRFVVWDDGIGIAADDLDRLFKPFVQLDVRLARAYEGTGLGLSLVRRLTELHGGTVAVESKPGHGSRFTVTLPWRRPGAAAAPERLEPTRTLAVSAVPADAHNILLLLVEDNEISYEMLADYLGAHGFRVLHATSGIDAIAMVQREHPQLVLMDVQMRDMDGITATTKIRQLDDAALAAVPIVGLTALAMPGDQERCLQAGMDAYLSKPVSMAMLTEVVWQLLAPGDNVDARFVTA